MGNKPKQRKGLIDYPQHRRILLVMVLLGVISFLPVILRLYGLMVLHYDEYTKDAQANQSRTTLITADRGNIYDCSMNLLAGSVSAPNLYLNPRELRQARTDLPGVARDLGEILGKDSQYILKKAGNLGRRYEQIGKSLEEETAARVLRYINQNELRGIH